jgi:hypothetical protein
MGIGTFSWGVKEVQIEMELSCRTGANVNNVWPFASIYKLPSRLSFIFKRDNLTLIEGNVFVLQENI